ncbi:LytR/AlgR family response regulator transcription factor [Ulvibacterium sp.]|uniref:LytR/AlgR family response regulator transcription factor n=1 Tax=Ulvibacterium sp. TaxID=2665914 RepID=UPI003CC5B390
MKMKCLIVDDEHLARKGLEDFVLRTPFLEHVASLSSALEALTFLKSSVVDIVFLDIQMPDMNGVELMEALNQPPQVIFTTAHREFAVDGFDLNATDFLLKPFSYTRFLKAVDKTVLTGTIGSEEDKTHIFIKSEGTIVKVQIDHITFVETAKDYVFVHTINDRYLTLVSLRQLEQELPDSKFMRVHRSYLVGLQHVKKLEGNLLYVGTQRITISRTLRNEVYQRIVGDNLIGRSSEKDV